MVITDQPVEDLTDDESSPPLPSATAVAAQERRRQQSHRVRTQSVAGLIEFQNAEQGSNSSSGDSLFGDTDDPVLPSQMMHAAAHHGAHGTQNGQNGHGGHAGNGGGAGSGSPSSPPQTQQQQQQQQQQAQSGLPGGSNGASLSPNGGVAPASSSSAASAVVSPGGIATSRLSIVDGGVDAPPPAAANFVEMEDVGDESSDEGEGDNDEPAGPEAEGDGAAEPVRFQLKVSFPNQSHTILFVDTDTTVDQLTGRVYSKARQKLGGHCPENFKFRVPDSEAVLRPGMTLSRVPYIRDLIKQQQDAGEVIPELIFVAPQLADDPTGRASSAYLAGSGGVTDLTPSEAFQQEIENLIGEVDVAGSEVDHFRASMRRLRQKIVGERTNLSRESRPNSDCYVLRLPDEVPQDTIRIRLYYPDMDSQVMSKTIQVGLDQPLERVMAVALEKGNMNAAPSRYIFKVTGRSEHLHGNHEIIAYDYVRRCVKLGPSTCAELNIVERARVEGQPEPPMHERPGQHLEEGGAGAGGGGQQVGTVTAADLAAAVADGVDDENNHHSNSNNSNNNGNGNGNGIGNGNLDNELQSAEEDEFAVEACSVRHTAWNKLKHISIWDIRRPFRVLICGVDGIPDTRALVKARKRAEASDVPLKLSIVASLYHGGKLMAETVQSDGVDYSANPRWQQWLTFGLDVCDIPRSCRICFSLRAEVAKKGAGNDANRGGSRQAADAGKDGLSDASLPLGWVNCQLIDHVGYLRADTLALRLWPEAAANPIGTCVENHVGTTTLFVHYDSYARPAVFPHWVPPAGGETSAAVLGAAGATGATAAAMAAAMGGGGGGGGGMGGGGIDVDSAFAEEHLDKRAKEKLRLVRERIDAIVDRDPLYNLDEDEIDLLWEHRATLPSRPKSLPKFLQAVAWNDRLAVQECHRMLASWPRLAPLLALELLDAKYADDRVRAYAVDCLTSISDIDLADVILQLTQVLKYEPYHDSALARFLLSRALGNPPLIGHLFFWHLKSEMHLLEIYERYGLLLEEYLRGCGRHREELRLQNEYIGKFAAIADMIKVEPEATRLKVLREGLDRVQMPEPFKLPLNPKMEVAGINVPKCKYMDSKKKPLWLNFSNADIHGSPILVMFKAGDDLRQDQLTLQMIRLMEKLWQANDLDLRLNPYGCISTGDEQGMLEIVLDSETTASITRSAGGATAAFSQTPIAKWLRENNKTDAEWNTAVENFVLSCAGYCVATYVLGIGDRHNDNIMINKRGCLFHIDFGHFLGNYKKKFGIKREKAPFVFTPDFAYVMGGTKSPHFKRFVDVSSRAYNILRKHASLFINLFAMMLSTGIPELTCEEDILYLRNAFCVEKNDQSAARRWTKLIKQALSSSTTQLNNFVHLLAH